MLVLYKSECRAPVGSFVSLEIELLDKTLQRQDVKAIVVYDQNILKTVIVRNFSLIAHH